MIFWIRLPNFVQIGAPTAEIWHHIYFWIWRPRPLNTTSSFVFIDVTAFRRWNQIWSRYLHWRLRYNYFRFRNTDVRHIGILLPVLITTTFRNLHVILHHATEFLPNRSTHCKNMTSFHFSRWPPCLNWRLRYNYFRFRNTNVRHIKNLLSVSISTICPKSGHYSASGYLTSSR